MKKFTIPNEISEELKKISDKYLECVYIKTNAFDIYLNDAYRVNVTCDKGIENISFNTRVNMNKFPVESVEELIHDKVAFEIFDDFYDEDEDCEFYSIRIKGSEVKLYFCINLDNQDE